ncbi:MAG: thiamine-phosphate kinase [Candidatus Omnitrophica bacterium]|nr:thiamine-phosphate kinase [Candidatus Omnitrophota bacterium]
MLLNRLGEFGLIKRIRKSIKYYDPSVIKGTGDDCAVLALDKNNYQLFTCDMLVEGVDFRHNEDPYLIGRKSLAVSISDIASCGGSPRYCLVSLSVTKKTSVAFADKFLRGMLDLAKKFKINIVGGDLTRSSQLAIDVSMLGSVEKKNLVLRSGAKNNDIIFVTGSLGGSISGKHLRFTPRVKEARFLVENFKINAMIDISDGLLQDLGHILEESGVGATVYEELIPLSKQAKNLKDALYSGEDFELLFTASPAEAKKILKLKPGISRPIGEITNAQGLRLIDKRGRQDLIKHKGFTHF